MNQVNRSPVGTDFLRGVDLFTGFSDEDLRKIAAIVHSRRYRKNSVIFLEGDPGEAVYFVRAGRVKVYKSAPDGREHICEIWEPGEAFALVVLLDHGAYPASAEALEESDLGLIRVQDFDRLMQESPQVAREFLRQVSIRLREARTRMRDIALKTVHGRIASLLLDLAGQKGSVTGRGTWIPLEFTHQELASLVGASRETITRVLAEFRRERAIEVEKDGLFIRDEQKLRGWM